MSVKLYGWNDSPFCLKVRMAARYKGVDLDLVSAEMSDLKRNEKQTGYHKVPFLVGDDLWLTDSTAILQWLEEQEPTPSIYPTDPAKRAECRLLEDWADEALNGAAEPVWFTMPGGAEKMMSRTADELEAGAVMRFILTKVAAVQVRRKFARRALRVGGIEATRKLTMEQLDLVEARLEAAGTPWLFGQEPTAADFAIAGQCRNLYFFEIDGARDRHRVTELVERAMDLVSAPMSDTTATRLMLEASPKAAA